MAGKKFTFVIPANLRLNEPSKTYSGTEHWLPSGAKYEVFDLYSKLVPGEYQREKKTAHVDSICGSFDRSAVRMPILHNLGKDVPLEIGDGQHTIAALKKMGYKKYMAEVYYGLSYERRALLFYNKNTLNKSMDGWVKFRAALHAKLANETSVRRIVEENKLSIPVKQGDETDFNTPGMLTTIYSQKGEPHFERVVRTLATCFKAGGRLDLPAQRNEFVRGLSNFLLTAQSVTPDGLKANLSRRNAGNIVSAATAKAGECQKVRSIERFICEELCRISGLPLPFSHRAATRKAA